jgi:TolB-like protein
VDASLKEKLKCLIFIPIISRTYCDPKSFAWENEFRRVITQASSDSIGIKIRLPGGNVASRVLPIQIYDLDPDDRKLVESELGGHLRAIEFIYREPGVNRPLSANEEHPESNLSKTTYRNQINKVANSIKDIITGMNNPEAGLTSTTAREKNKIPVSLKPKFVIAALALIVLLAAGIYFFPRLFSSSPDTDKSIAVLPFKLLSDEPDKQYLADGMMDAITLYLSRVKGLRVMSRTSVEQYRGATKTTRVIGKELGVSYLLEGSFQKYGDNVRLIVQLINADRESHVWAGEYNNKWQEVFSLQSEVARKIGIERGKSQISGVPGKDRS